MKLQHMKRSDKRRHQLLLCALLTAISVIALSSPDRADALYILTGASDSAIVLDSPAKARDFSSQMVSINTNVSGYDINLSAGQDVVISRSGAVISVQAEEETVSMLLNRLHITPGPLDMIAVDLSGSVVRLTIESEIVYYDQTVESVAYETVRVPTADLPKGTEQVSQAGCNGTRTAIYEMVYSGGELISRQFVEELNSTVVNEVVQVGTGVSSVTPSDRIANISKSADGSGVLTFASGATMKFSAAKSMTATAYTAGYGGADYTTATGTLVKTGTVAVDKRVIPLGTRMYIVTNDGKVIYGMAVAADTGVRGNRVDLYYDTYNQCINFGRRSCTVYILQ